MRLNRVLLLLVACGLSSVAAASGGPAEKRSDFDDWMTSLRQEALAQEISAQILDAALTGVQPLGKVIELDRRQPESTMSFSRYRGRVVSRARIRDGRRKMQQHREILAAVAERYGVQPRFLVALWGTESRFGEHMGDFRVVDSLVTLAYDGRRGSYFRGELLAALQILDERHVEPQRMLGSWAGAMGQVQFMPSTFRQYSVDFDGDARRDIWGTTGDALASAANYLARSGWRSDQTWGRQATLPSGFDPSLVGRKVRRTLPQWQALGVRQADGSDLPGRPLRASLVQPGGPEGPTYLVYDNYRVLLRWNRSDFFATSVGLLSDALK